MFGKLRVNNIISATWRLPASSPVIVTPSLLSAGSTLRACPGLLICLGRYHLSGLLEIACKLLKALFCRALILNGLSGLLDHSFGPGFFI